MVGSQHHTGHGMAASSPAQWKKQKQEDPESTPSTHAKARWASWRTPRVAPGKLWGPLRDPDSRREAERATEGHPQDPQALTHTGTQMFIHSHMCVLPHKHTGTRTIHTHTCKQATNDTRKSSRPCVVGSQEKLLSYK